MAKKLPNELLNELIQCLPLNRHKWISIRVSWAFNTFLCRYMTEERQNFKDQVSNQRLGIFLRKLKLNLIRFF